MLDIFLRLYRYRIVGANSTLAASAIYIIGVRLVEQFEVHSMLVFLLFLWLLMFHQRS